MTHRQFVLNHLWDGEDPFAAFPRDDHPVDPQGWNSDHPALAGAIDRQRPRLVIEVGVWKGGSVMTMARRMRDTGVDGVILAVDTWLGSSEHWMDRRFFKELRTEAGYPRLFHTFMANILAEGLQDYVVPMPLDSTNAAVVIKSLDWKADVMHIDAGHDYDSVIKDLNLWWPQLAPGGTLVLDDYWREGAWPDVRRAVDDFFRDRPVADTDIHEPKYTVTKAPA